MKEMKFFPLLLAVLLGLGLCACNLGSVSTDDVADYVSGIEPGQAVSLATNLLTLPAVQDLANAIMADSNLVATLTNAWNDVEGDYVTPDEIEDDPAAPPASGDISAALQIMLREDPSITGVRLGSAEQIVAALRKRRDMFEVVAFILSDDHLKLRSRLRLSLA